MIELGALLSDGVLTGLLNEWTLKVLTFQWSFQPGGRTLTQLILK